MSTWHVLWGFSLQVVNQNLKIIICPLQPIVNLGNFHCNIPESSQFPALQSTSVYCYIIQSDYDFTPASLLPIPSP